jgi:inward rectifier potassium channel
LGPDADYAIEVVGAEPPDLRDFYHLLLQQRWPVTLTVVAIVYLLANLVFAFAYWFVGGIGHIEHGAAGSLRDAFFFSVQTMGTIGYGALTPESTTANVLVVAESITGLTLTALFTGLVFAKFSRATSRILFSRDVTISPVNGVPTLSFRVGNARGNQIVDAQVRLCMIRTETTLEGHTLYRTHDLTLVRDRILSLSRSWTLQHVIDETSPLYGETPASFRAKDCEIHALLVGLDDVSLQTLHAIHRFYAPHVLWGARHVDILSEVPSAAGTTSLLRLDIRRFHDTEPTPPTESFPFPGPP